MEAARHIVSGAAPQNFDDLKKFGLTDEQIHDLHPDSADPQSHGVWPDHWRAVTIFGGMSTQWRTAVGSQIVWLGLDYSALPVVEARIGHHPQAIEPSAEELFYQLRVLERTAIPLLNKG